MEDQDSQTAPAQQPQKKGVMDIRPPMPQAGVPGTESTVPPNPAAPTEKTPESASGLHHPPDDGAPTQPDPGTPTAPDAEQETSVPPTPHDDGRKLPKAVIAVAVIVAAGLIGLSVFAYMRTQEKPHTDDHTTTPMEEVRSKDPATAADVDAATKQIDEALKSEDETDFSESELTDQSLGL